MPRYFIDSFGCAKNLVDSENMMNYLNLSNEFYPAEDAENADLIIVNSCGFIESAKRESIDAVLSRRKIYPKKKILLAGCLAERYKNDLAESLPEADGLFGVTDLKGIAASAAKLFTDLSLPANQRFEREGFHGTVSPGNRPLLTLPGSAYVKISEGCNNRCSYCAIPLIRGPLKSREMNNVLDECKILLGRGVKELCVIAQDVASYGLDLQQTSSAEKSRPFGLPELLKAISGLKGEFWVRLLYIHPDNFPKEIIEIIKNDRRILPYFDFPFQHASEKILRQMNRKGTTESYLKLAETMRSNLPDSVIRTTFLTGFPGEDENDFNALLDFQSKLCPDWMGCFTYSREEDTPAYSMKNRVPKKIAAERKKILEERQIQITEKQMDRFLHREFGVLLEEKIEGEDEIWLGRLPFQAPEVDGSAVIFHRKEGKQSELVPGRFVKCKITARAGFDLEAEIIAGN